MKAVKESERGRRPGGNKHKYSK